MFLGLFILFIVLAIAFVFAFEYRIQNDQWYEYVLALCVVAGYFIFSHIKKKKNEKLSD